MASFYGMIANFDENLGGLLKSLDDLQIAENTVLIYMTDNGSAAGYLPNAPAGTWGGFNAGMRDRKASEYDGGHRVPCFVRWPAGGIGGGRDEDLLTAHIDLLPTLVELCGLTAPAHRDWDGISLARLLRGEPFANPERTLFVHSQRLERPEKWRKCAVMTEQWRLVNRAELYDVRQDPGQQANVAESHSEVVSTLRSEYDRWWESLEPVFGEEVRIGLGHPSANPTLLCCHDWHGEPIPVMQDSVAKDPAQNGYWSVDVTAAGRYEFHLRSRPPGTAQGIGAKTAKLQIGDIERTVDVATDAEEAVITVELPAGPAHLTTEFSGGDRPPRGAYYVEVRRLSD